MPSGKTRRHILDSLSIIDTVNERWGKFVSFAVLIMMIIIVWEVVVRYGFNSPTSWVHETAAMLFGAYVILGSGFTLRRGASPEHIRMDAIYIRFSPKTRTIIELVASILFFLFVGVMLWKGWTMALRSLELSEHSFTTWSPPVYPLKFCIPVGAFLLLIQGVVKLIRDVNLLVTRN